jgi:O-succinylbenzoic acid--CoA ligase
VLLSHGALAAARRATAARLGLEGVEDWHCCLPPWHVAGLMTIVRALLSGGRARLAYPFEARALQGARGLVSLVPTQLKRALDHGVDLTCFDAVLLGGSAIPPGLVARARAAGVVVVTTYGMTETCGGVVYDGRPLDGVEVRSRAGRLALKGPMLFSGYRGGPDDPFDDDGFFVTSDLGEVSGDGTVSVLGRADTAIVTAGYKVFPERVAALLLTDERVREAAVVGLPDPDRGEVVTAVIVPAGEQAPSLAELRALVEAELPTWAAPRRLEVMSALPRLPSGKVDRAALVAAIVGRRGQG